MADDWIIDFPTLADLQDAWVRRHVRQPDGILRGKPFCWSDWQFWYAAHRWKVREDAEFIPPEEVTVDNPLVLNQAFQYRLTGCIGPQKTGKGPTEASCAILEACGPVVFAGWAKPATCTAAPTTAALADGSTITIRASRRACAIHRR